MSSAEKMRLIGDKVMKDVIPDVGFVLVVFDHETSGNSNYVSSITDKGKIVKALEDLLEKVKHNGNGA